jgi:hypothetical protein
VTGSLSSPPLTGVQIITVAPGSAAVIELSLPVPGRYLLADHTLTRMERGLAGALVVVVPQTPEIFHAGGAGARDHSRAKPTKTPSTLVARLYAGNKRRYWQLQLSLCDYRSTRRVHPSQNSLCQNHASLCAQHEFHLAPSTASGLGMAWKRDYGARSRLFRHGDGDGDRLERPLRPWLS